MPFPYHFLVIHLVVAVSRHVRRFRWPCPAGLGLFAFGDPRRYLDEDGTGHLVADGPEWESWSGVNQALIGFHALRQSGGLRNFVSNAATSKIMRQKHCGWGWDLTSGFLDEASNHSAGWLAEHSRLGLSGRFINFGAGNGLSPDPLTQYMQQTQNLPSAGMAVERHPDRAAEYQDLWINRGRRNITLHRTHVTPQNVWDLVQRSALWNNPASDFGYFVDIVKVDIDCYDCHVIQELLQSWKRHQKSLSLPQRMPLSLYLQIEVEAALPPPIRMMRRYHPQLPCPCTATENNELSLACLYGRCSIAYLAWYLKRHGYEFFYWSGGDALFVHVSAIANIEASMRELGISATFPVNMAECYGTAFFGTHTPIHVIREWYFSRHVNATDIHDYMWGCQKTFLANLSRAALVDLQIHLSHEALLKILDETLVVLPHLVDSIRT